VRHCGKRGIAIISVLFLAILVLGFVSAAIASTPVTLLSAKGFGDQQQASLACEAGLAYAQTRLRENPRWRGSIADGPIQVTSASDSSITVYEDHGNVVGLLIAEDGSRSQFRIRFNAQDGPGGTDETDDPNSEFLLDSLTYLSMNNLTILASLPRQTTTGDPLPDAAPREVLIVVEGRAGPALRDHTAQAVNAPPNGRRLVSERLEVSLRPGYDDALDAVIMAAGDVEVELPPTVVDGKERLVVRSDDSLVSPRVRTKQSFNVAGGTYVNYDSNGVIQTASGDVGPTTNVNSNTALGTEGSSQFLELNWDDVKKADPTENSTIRLKAGTYVLDDDLALNYYDLDYDSFERAHRNDSLPTPTVLSSNLQEVVENTGSLAPNAVKFWKPDTIERRVKAVLEFNADVSVTPTASSNGLSLITSQGPISAQTDEFGNSYPGVLNPSAKTATPNLGIWLRGNDTESITLSSRGDVLVGSVLYGEKGGITSQGDLSMRGTSLLDSSNSQTLTGTVSTNLYAKGDIDISTYRSVGDPSRGTVGKYGHFLSSGVTYAWGDVRIQSRENNVPVGGVFRQRGALVAYGGDPSLGSPGQAGTGNISISARSALFTYDSSYVGLVEPDAPPDSFRIVSLTKR
jgi:hypothetical protein